MKSLEEIRNIFEGDKFATKQAGIIIDEVGENYSRVSMKLCDHHKNARGGVMGGAIYTLADFAFAVAANSAELATVTVSANISYLKGVKGDVLYGEARPIKEGRSIVFYEVKVTDNVGVDVALVNITGAHV